MQRAGKADDLLDSSILSISNQYLNFEQDDSFCAGVTDSGESPTGSAIIDTISHETAFHVSEKVVMQAQRKLTSSSNNTPNTTKSSNDSTPSKLSHPPIKRTASHTIVGTSSQVKSSLSSPSTTNNTDNDIPLSTSPLSAKSLSNRKLNASPQSPPPRPATARARLNSLDSVALASKVAKKSRPPPKPTAQPAQPPAPSPQPTPAPLVQDDSDSSDEEMNGMASSRLPTNDTSVVVELTRDTLVMDPNTVTSSLAAQLEASLAPPAEEPSQSSEPNPQPPQPNPEPTNAGQVPKRPVKMPSRPPPALPPGSPDPPKEPPRRPSTAKPQQPPRTPSATKITSPPPKPNQASKPQSISAAQGAKIASSLANSSDSNTPTKTTSAPAPATKAATAPVAPGSRSNRNSLAPPSRPAPKIPPPASKTTSTPTTQATPEGSTNTTTQPPVKKATLRSANTRSIILKPDVDFSRNTAQFDSQALQEQLKQMELNEKPKDYEWMDSSSDEESVPSTRSSVSVNKNETSVESTEESSEESSDDEPMNVSSRVQPKRNQEVVEFSRDTVSFDSEAVKKQLQEEEAKIKSENKSRPGSIRKTQDDSAPKVPITATKPAAENPAQARRRSNTVDNFYTSPIIQEKKGIFRTSSSNQSSPTTPRSTVSPRGTARDTETAKDSGSMRREWQSMSAIEHSKHIQEMATEATIRICMIGLECGKSSLIRRFLFQEFNEGYDPSVEDTHSVTVSFDGTGNTNYKLDILDCGSTFYNAFKDKWLQNADSFIIVYSVNSKPSFDAVSLFIDDIIKTKNNKLVPILLCGNKADVKNRVVSTFEGRQLSEHFRCGFMEVSAATGHNVNQMFQYITDTVVRLRTLSISEQQIDVASLYTGWVQKRKKGNFWKKRYIIVTSNAIRYFHKVPNNMNDNSSIKGLIPLKGLFVTCDKHEAESLLRARMPKKGSVGTFTPSSISKGGSSDGKNMFLLTNQNVLYELKLAATDQRNALIRVIQDVIDQQHSDEKKHTNNTESPKPTTESETTDESSIDKETLIKKVSQMFNNQSADNAIKQFIAWHQHNQKDADIPAAIANFLLCEGLSKRKIGDYLGHQDNVEVLHKFMSQVSFANHKFDEGLRQVLQLFLLPGEAQKIDRIMEVFAIHYCKQNPTAFDNPDTAYVLAFSLIMLNTDAHNKAIPADKKMTKQQFLRNNKGINQGKDLPEAYLSELYDNIVSNEISMDYQRDDIVQWDLQGSVLLQAVGKSLKKPSPKKKWCIISGNCLYAFNAPQDASPFLIVPLQSSMICDIDHQTRFIKITCYQSLIKAAKKSKSKTYSEILISPEDGKLLRWVLALTNSQTLKRQTMSTDAPPVLQTN